MEWESRQLIDFCTWRSRRNITAVVGPFLMSTYIVCRRWSNILSRTAAGATLFRRDPDVCSVLSILLSLVSFVCGPSTGRPHCASSSVRPSARPSARCALVTQERKTAASSNLVCSLPFKCVACQIILKPEGHQATGHEWHHNLGTAGMRYLNLTESCP